MKAFLTRKISRAKRFYGLYTSGLNQTEVERLLQKDALGALEYYKGRTPLRDQSLKTVSFKTKIRAVKEIFFSFLMQLTPARRLFYGLSLVIFLFGFFGGQGLWILAAFAIVNLLLALELADKLTTRDELEIAREIQVSLEPQTLPEIRGLSISAFSRPAKIVGGDFFNIVKRKDDQMIGILGDVAGKGIPAALYAAHVQSIFEALSEKSASPAQIMIELNSHICRHLREGDFITAVIAYYDAVRSALTIARAGHNWPLYYSARSQTIEPLNPPGVCLGLDADTGFSECLQEKTLSADSGDILLLYSDGITEAMNPENRLFDLSRLTSALKESAHYPAEKIIEGINQRVDEFVLSEELHDDITMVAIKVN